MTESGGLARPRLPVCDNTKRPAALPPTEVDNVTIIAGPDADGLGDALTSLGVEVARIDGVATREKLLGAGIEAAETLVLTDTADATAISIAKDDNPNVRVVVYARQSLPEFARAQADLAVDPELLTPDVVAEELA